ncbi:transglycosylase family protein [Streptomyces sp. NPDC127033]|uniref:transglycosylase family protein n=1 Tax=Streptomyces sp. NPDC127033 TaxID=3347110 RepID=UPI003662DC16
MAGSAIAIPLLGAGAASAADSSTWDRVAGCESGGTWSANLGNGYYGGLQMSQETWDEFGGGDYAERPDLASRSQQIAVAEKVFEAQGAQAWSSCAAVSGLTEAVGGAVGGIVEGVTGGGNSTDPSGTPSDSPSGDAYPSGDGVTDPGAEADADGKTSPDPSTSPSPGATGSAAGTDDADGKGEASKGKHRGQAADESASPGTEDEERASGSRASRGAGGARDGAGLTDGVEREVEKVVTTVGGHLSLASGGQKVVGGWV